MMLAGGVVPTGDELAAMADAYKGTKRQQFRTHRRRYYFAFSCCK
jgi:hypothetical protein